MNRRTLLRAAATLPALTLAGCQGLGFSTPVMVNIQNETDVDRNVAVTAYDLDMDRQTYDEAVNAPSGNTASLGHLTNTDQLVRVALFERAGGDQSNGGDETDREPSADETETESDGTETGAGANDTGAGANDTGTDGGDDRLEESDEDVAAVEETLIGERTQSITVRVTGDGLELDVAAREP